MKVGRPLRRPPPRWDSKRSAAETHRWAWGDEPPSTTERGLACRVYPRYWYLGVAGVAVSSWAVLLLLLGGLVPLPLYLGRAIFDCMCIPLTYTHDLVGMAIGHWALYGTYMLAHRPLRIMMAMMKRVSVSVDGDVYGVRMGAKGGRKDEGDTSTSGNGNGKEKQGHTRTSSGSEDDMREHSAYRGQLWALYRGAVLRWCLQLGVAFLATGSIYLHCCVATKGGSGTGSSSAILSFFFRASIVGATLHLCYVSLLTSPLPTRVCTLLSLPQEWAEKVETIQNFIVDSMYQPGWLLAIRQAEDNLSLKRDITVGGRGGGRAGGAFDEEEDESERHERQKLGRTSSGGTKASSSSSNGWTSTGIANVATPSHALPGTGPTTTSTTSASTRESVILDAKLMAITTFEYHLHCHSPLTLSTVRTTDTDMFAVSGWGVDLGAHHWRDRRAGVMGLCHSSIGHAILLQLLTLLPGGVEGEVDTESDLLTPHQRYCLITSLLLLAPVYLPIMIRVLTELMKRVHGAFYDEIYLEGRKLSNLDKVRPREGSITSTD